MAASTCQPELHAMAEQDTALGTLPNEVALQVASEDVCSRRVLSARGLPYSIGSAHSTSALSLCWVLLLYLYRMAHIAAGDVTSG